METKRLKGVIFMDPSVQTVEDVKKANKNNWKLKVGILGISLFLQVAGSNMAAIPLIAKAYPGVSTTNIQALFTIPSFSIMLFILISNPVVKWLGKRNTVILGMIATLVGALIPLANVSYGILVFSRLLVGAGIGLFTSLAVSLIGDCFSGEEQKTLLGLQSAMSTLGNSAMTFIAGLLLGITWQASFLYMLIIVPFLILFMVSYTPKMEKATTVKTMEADKSKSKKHAKIPAMIYGTFCMLFLFFAAYMVVSTASALVIQENNLTNQGWLSTEFSIAGLIGAGYSAAYSKIFKVLKHYTPVVAVAIASVGFLIMANASNMVIYFIGLLCLNCGTLIIVYVYDTILGDVDSSIGNLVISIAQVFNNLGAFASPYVISFFRNMVGVKTQAGSMVISAVILAVIAVVFLVMAISRSKSSKNTSVA